MARRSYRISRKLMILSVLLAIGLWRGADLMERMGSVLPGPSTVDAAGAADLIQRTGIDLDALQMEQSAAGPGQLRNGFRMAPGRTPGSVNTILNDLAGRPGEAPAEDEAAEDAGPPPPKPDSMVRVRRKPTAPEE